MKYPIIGRLSLVGFASLAAFALSACGTDPASPQGVSDAASLSSIEGPDAAFRHGPGILAFAHSLDLSDTQLADIRAIYEDARERSAAVREQMREIVGVPAGERFRRRHREELTDEQRAALRPLIQQIRSIRQDAHERALALLTDEQRKRLEELVEAHRDDRRDHRHRRPGRDHRG